MSRKPQTCHDCSRRKIKCDKIIPCSNCTKRGAAHLCRRAEITSTSERQGPRPEYSLSPSASQYQTIDSPSSVPKRQDPESPAINERILGLVTTLSERVKHVEAKLDGLDPRKRPMIQSLLETQEVFGSTANPSPRPLKQARLTHAELDPAAHLQTDETAPTETTESNSVQNSSDAEAEDAATVLEFLAWGRLKDSSLTNGVRDPTGVEASYPDKDVIQVAQAWEQSPRSVPISQVNMETLGIPQIQELLPRKTQVLLLAEYHASWLLFMHSSYHVQTFSRELDRFYEQDNGIIKTTSIQLQWTALLFTILCGSMSCAKRVQIVSWGFHQDEQGSLAKQWYQAAIECLNIAQYQQIHNMYSVQAISSMTISAHILGFSNSQSVLLASAVRVAHSLGLHRLPRSKKTASDHDGDNLTETIQKELGRRVWQQLATQDWFSVPFSETYCVNPLHFTTVSPLHCDEDTMQALPLSKPTITSYGSFLYRIACLMPALQDRLYQVPTLAAKYDQVLHFDRLMRDLVLTQLPQCLNSQTAPDPSWPCWVKLARRCLTVTSAHKIIMIHRRFLGMSFHEKRYAFTRRTCLAAAKTIINEVKEEASDETPLLWTMQAFCVAAAIILSLDNFNRHQSAREYAEHRQLVTQTIEVLSSSIAISSIAARGTRLLTELLAEEQNVNSQVTESENAPQKTSQKQIEGFSRSKSSEKNLNVAAFVKKFCESDQPSIGNSPIATSHVPLWLQDSYFRTQPADSANGLYHDYNTGIPQPSFEYVDPAYQMPPGRRQPDNFANVFTQNFGEPFDIKSDQWFGDLTGLAPSHSI